MHRIDSHQPKIKTGSLVGMFADWAQRIGQKLAAVLEPNTPQQEPSRVAAPPRLAPLDLELSGHPLDFFEVRSEDVRFSPSSRLAAVVTTQGRILLFAVDTAGDPVRAELLTALVSPDLRGPHGVDWVDEETIVVANRQAGFAFFRVPRANEWQPETAVAAVSTVQPHWFGAPGETRSLRGRDIVTGPGSLRIHGGYIYAGCNKANTITRHRILDGPSCEQGELIAQEQIEIPDSAVVSPDGTWLAVGDHDHHRVLIFRLGEASPSGELSDPRMAHPHGTAFDPTGRLLIAADAGGRGLYVFHAPDGNWNVVQTEAASQALGVAEAVFARVQSETPEFYRALEGGTKGIDLSKDGRVLVTTCRGQTLSFFALNAAGS